MAVSDKGFEGFEELLAIDVSIEVGVDGLDGLDGLLLVDNYVHA